MAGYWWLPVGAALVFLLLWKYRPWPWFGRLVYGAVAGLVLVVGYNLVSPYLGVSVPLNPVTVTLTGLLGVPGLAALVLLQLLA